MWIKLRKKKRKKEKNAPADWILFRAQVTVVRFDLFVWRPEIGFRGVLRGAWGFYWVDFDFRALAMHRLSRFGWDFSGFSRIFWFFCFYLLSLLEDLGIDPSSEWRGKVIADFRSHCFVRFQKGKKGQSWDEEKKKSSENRLRLEQFPGRWTRFRPDEAESDGFSSKILPKKKEQRPQNKTHTHTHTKRFRLRKKITRPGGGTPSL